MEGFFQPGCSWVAANMDERRKLWLPYYQCEHILCSNDISRWQGNQFSPSEICFEGRSPKRTSINRQKMKHVRYFNQISVSTGFCIGENFPSLFLFFHYLFNWNESCINRTGHQKWGLRSQASILFLKLGLVIWTKPLTVSTTYQHAKSTLATTQ